MKINRGELQPGGVPQRDPCRENRARREGWVSIMLAYLSYHHALRVQGWIGHLAVRIEHEFFGDDAFTEMAKERFRRADRLAVEERVRRLSEPLMPLRALDRLTHF